jgi:probable phosphoglycerate mutase
VDFDGGSRGNPGVGGAGSRLVLVRDNVCTVLATRAAFLQERRTTNNVAEFSGLVGGLELARDFLAQSADPAPGLLVTVRGDSRLVIDLMQDRTEGRDPALLALADQASALVEGLEARGCEVTFQHMRREFNTEADALANEAMDTATSSLTHTADFALARATLPLPKPDAQDADEPEAEDAGAKAKDSGREPGPTRPSRHIPRLTAALARAAAHVARSHPPGLARAGQAVSGATVVHGDPGGLD